MSTLLSFQKRSIFSFMLSDNVYFMKTTLDDGHLTFCTNSIFKIYIASLMCEEGQYFGKSLQPLIGEDVHLSNYNICLSNPTCRCCFSETCLWKSRRTHSCESISLTDRSCKVNSTESQYHHPAGDRKKPVRLIAKRFQCTKCHKIFKTLEKAQRHEERLHGEKVAPTVFVCPHPHCNKIYSAQSQLKEHVDVVHEQLRPFACDQCEMKFGRAGGLRRHVMMVHSQIRHKCPYPNCDHPGYKCTKALAAHIRSVHTLDRPFSCLFCEKTFVRKNDLKVHEMTHSSQCEYTCEKCGSLFRRLIYLHKHEKRCIQGIKKKENQK
uniref:Zinc finger protein n=1 Tax=Heterorhabditis bacteriophora TaxID=37862 RepID=A0A1I7X3T4_HETBA